MSYGSQSSRPAILNVVSVVSFLLSVADVCGFLCCLSVGFGIATLSWLGGPGPGMVGTLVGTVLVFAALVRSLLSILLFLAAWNTWQGKFAGRSLHLTWAWLTIILDLIDLVLTWGWNPATWWGLVYAVCLIYVMDLPEVHAYFDRNTLGPPPKATGIDNDLV